jgi:orotidine-5'-phosphate decarboxylase
MSFEVREKIIVALDVPSRERALEVVKTLSPEVTWFKVGMELFSATGPDIVRELTESGAKVFVDLKFHDIPNTVAMAGAAITRSGAAMFNVHCCGGLDMMQRTVEQTRETANREGLTLPKLIGVTVLTSMSQEVLTQQVGVNRELSEQVREMALLAKRAGMDGVVASPREIKLIREACGPEFLIVTPGVRPVWASLDDQHRVMSPGEAHSLGATHLVIGRPITAAANPREAWKKILSELEE